MTELISVQQLSEKINFTPITIYRWVKDRKIPFVKMPGRMDEIDAAAENHVSINV